MDFGVDGALLDDNAAVETNNIEEEEEASDNDAASEANGADVAVEEANGAKKLKCSYKKCNNQLATKEQLSCAVSLCSKKFMLLAFSIIYCRLSLTLRCIQCNWIGGPREITGPSTLVGRVIMGKLV